MPKCKPLFRFEAFWCKEEGCRETIARCWNVENVGGRMEAWKTKIQTTRCGLIRWSTDKFKARKFELQRLNSHLGILQRNWEANGKEIDEVTTMINRLEAQEEEYWASRSRIRWLQADVKGIVADCLEGVGCPSTINSTHIALIPKVPNPEGVNQFRPISLCNYSYKLRKAKTKFEMGIKLDMNKAYDRWNGTSWRQLWSTWVSSEGGLLCKAVQQGFLEGLKISALGPVSLQKSVVYFEVNTPTQLAAELCNILDMPKVDDPGKYLGLPTIWGRSKRETLQFIKDIILAKIAGWKPRFLTQAGKEVLIKVVTQAIPMYPMCVFRLPVSLCNDIDVAAARFWWAGADKDQGIHWVNWKDLGQTKKEGERYFPDVPFLEAKKDGRASWTWASLLEGRDLILKGARWQIMGGQEVRFWEDNWVPSLVGGTPLLFITRV
ncbi:hypothetical protein FF1_046480 [Malus domestica]